jgi:hypothetical protein
MPCSTFRIDDQRQDSEVQVGRAVQGLVSGEGEESMIFNEEFEKISRFARNDMFGPFYGPIKLKKPPARRRGLFFATTIKMPPVFQGGILH